MWGVNTEVIPVVVGGLGTVTKNIGDYLSKIPGVPDLFMCQKICLLGSSRILRDVLGQENNNPQTKEHILGQILKSVLISK